MNKKLIAAIVLGLCFITADVLSIIKGIEQHELWRVLLAGGSLIVITVLAYVGIKHLQKTQKKA